jgi:hypothetical protein
MDAIVNRQPLRRAFPTEAFADAGEYFLSAFIHFSVSFTPFYFVYN